MKKILSWVLVIQSAAWISSAVLLLFVPAWVVGLLGMVWNGERWGVLRLLGALLLVLGLACFSERQRARRSAMLCYAAVDVVALVFSAYGAITGACNWLGWLLAIGGVALAAALLLVLPPKEQGPRPRPVPKPYKLSPEELADAARGASKWTNELLDSLRQTADPITDPIIADVIAPKTPDGKPDYVAAEKLLIWLRDWTAQPTAEQPKTLRDFFNAPLTLPDWCDPAKLRLAERLFESFGMLQVTCIALDGIPRFFTNGPGSKSFALAKIFNPDVVKNRVIEIVQMICHIGAKDGFFPTPKKGDGILTVQKLRVIHSILRVFLRPQWNIPKSGQPICQEDLAFASLCFCFSVIDGGKKLGFIRSIDEEEAIYTAWKLFAHTVGVQPTCMPGDMADGRSLVAITALRMSGPSDEGSVLTAELLETAEGWMPSVLKAVPASLLRYLAGDNVADCLGVPPSELGIVDDVARFLGHEVREHEEVFRFLGNHIAPVLVRSLAYEQRRNQRTRFIIPGNVQEAWQIDVNIQ
jgi:hypothetical protein